MTFPKNFCSSPWFHARINNNGSFEHCRWGLKPSRVLQERIQNTSVVHFFQKSMSPMRRQLLQGEAPAICQDCHVMEKHGKVSGRQKQLLKTGVYEPLDRTLLSSPWLGAWRHSDQHQGDTDLLPQDWQIDLGNHCNSACLFCTPHSSSRLATEYHRLGLIDSLPERAWSEDPALLAKLLDVLEQSPTLAYLHFIGGETMITPAFRVILEALRDRGLSEKVTIGFTTNLTVWDQDLIDLLMRFKQINLGVSVECLHKLNDYLRWPGRIERTIEILDSWRHQCQKAGWLMQIRTTPTLFSIWHLDTVYDYAITHGIAVESCNFLTDPAYLRMSLLPPELRQKIVERLKSMGSTASAQQIINTRDPNHARDQALQDRDSYVKYLESTPVQQELWPDLVRHLTIMERSRGNRILDYLPEYENFLRSVGYAA